MKPLPHVHTYVLDKDGKPISKCIDSDRHPSFLSRALVAAKTQFQPRDLFRFTQPARAALPVKGPAQ